VCEVVRERDGEGIAGVAVDFSARGIQAVTRSRVLTGEPVRVTFRTPITGRWLSLRGTVARVIHGRRPNDRGRRLGIEFDASHTSDRNRLDEASDRLDAMPFWA
jgi:hypothetical protein